MTLKPPTLPKPKHPLDRVAFAGPMCAGKTTLANILVSKYFYHKFNFAGVLKQTVSSLYGEEALRKDNNSRKMLQELADDLKKWDPNLFTTHLLLDLEDYYKRDHDLLVVDDLRFKHEYEALKKNGFTIIGVACREDVRMQRIYSLYPDTDATRFYHPSEIEWREMTMDYWIDSTGPSAEISLRELVEERHAIRTKA